MNHSALNMLLEDTVELPNDVFDHLRDAYPELDYIFDALVQSRSDLSYAQWQAELNQE
jgi:hypothetical protein